jgi:LysM repeat protein
MPWHTRKDESIRGRIASLDFKAQRKTLILGGVGIVVLLIIVIALFSGCGSELSTEDLASIQARFGQLEKRLTRLEGMEDKIVFLERQEKEMQRSMVEAEKSERSLTQRLDKLSQKVDQLEKTMTPVPVKSEAPLTIQKIPLPQATERYHEVRSGDTLYWIAQQYGTSVEELCHLNHITPNQVIYPGQKLLVAPEGSQ